MDLQRALEHWRAYRDPRLADLVRGLSKATPRSAVAGGRSDHAQWLEREGHHDPADLPALLDALPKGDMGQRRERLARLVARGPDPRLVDAAVRWFDNPDLTAFPATHRFWQEVRELIITTLPEDADLRARVRERVPGGLRPTLHQRWLAEQRPRGPRPRPLPAKLEQALASRLADLETPDDPVVEALLERVAGAPDDDEVRSVLADRLTDRDDPRGTFIRLQLERHATHGAHSPDWNWGLPVEELPPSERALYAAHAADWFGAIDSHAVPYVERGFVKGLLVATVGSDGHVLAEAPGLGTVQRIALVDQLGVGRLRTVLDRPIDGAAALFSSPRLRNLTRLRQVLPEELADAVPAFRLEHLHLAVTPDEAQWDVLRPMLASVEELTVPWSALASDLGVVRAPRLVFHPHGRLAPGTPDLPSAIEGLPSAVSTVVLFDGGRSGLGLSRRGGAFRMQFGPPPGADGVSLGFVRALIALGLPTECEVGTVYCARTPDDVDPAFLDRLPRAPLDARALGPPPHPTLPPWTTLRTSSDDLDWAFDQPVERIEVTGPHGGVRFEPAQGTWMAEWWGTVSPRERYKIERHRHRFEVRDG